jgi:hypothetical protein
LLKMTGRSCLVEIDLDRTLDIDVQLKDLGVYKKCK